MKLIVGLGNPGIRYEKTRHNTGFKVLDEIAKQWHVDISQEKFKGKIAKVNYEGTNVILLKPITYMNLSGESVGACMNFYKIEPEDLLIIYDDMDLPVGKIRLRAQGSSGGHNGIKNIVSMIQTEKFPRIRVGIGKDAQIDTIDYVLGKVKKEEWEDYEKACLAAKEAAIYSITHSFEKTMSLYNRKD